MPPPATTIDRLSDPPVRVLDGEVDPVVATATLPTPIGRAGHQPGDQRRGAPPGRIGRRREIGELGEQLVEATAAIPRRDRSAASAGRDVSKAEAERGRGLERLAAARDALEGAQHANLVEAVRAGAVVGDPCPVCGVPIAVAPEGGGSADIAAAKRSLKAAPCQSSAQSWM